MPIHAFLPIFLPVSRFNRDKTGLYAVIFQTIQARPPAFGFSVPAVSPKTALFSAQEEIPVREAEGRILASAVLSCPPAIPVAVCGERLDKQAFSRLRRNHHYHKIRIRKFTNNLILP